MSIAEIVVDLLLVIVIKVIGRSMEARFLNYCSLRYMLLLCGSSLDLFTVTLPLTSTGLGFRVSKVSRFGAPGEKVHVRLVEASDPVNARSSVLS